MAESTQQVLSRVRKPRVHITYDVETLGAEEKKELPFVVGVLADLSGEPYEPLKSMRERKFIEIDPDNFNEIMTRMTPGVKVKVTNTLAGDDSELAVELKFNSMADFEPASIIEQVKPLKKLLETRNRLRDLLTRVDRSEELELILQTCLTDEEEMKKLSSELGEAGFTSEDNTSEGEGE